MNTQDEPKGTIPIGARIPAALAKSFKDEAAKHEVSVSQFLIETLREKVTKEAK